MYSRAYVQRPMALALSVRIATDKGASPSELCDMVDITATGEMNVKIRTVRMARNASPAIFTGPSLTLEVKLRTKKSTRSQYFASPCARNQPGFGRLQSLSFPTHEVSTGCILYS